MASRTLSAKTYSDVVLQDGKSKIFSSSDYADPAVTDGSQCVGGSIHFSGFRGWGKSYYFDVYIGDEFAFETKEINNQNSKEHEFTAYIAPSTVKHDVVLRGSGEIKIVVHDNTYPYNDDVCGFYSDCTVTIKASHELIPTPCIPPSKVTVEKTMTSDATIMLTWIGDYFGTNNSIIGYFIQYADSADKVNWTDWYGDITVNGIIRKQEVPMPEMGWYRKYRVFTLGSAGIEYRSKTGTESNVTYRGHAALEGFTDSPLVVRETPVKALHMQELQDRANTLRGYNGLAAYKFTEIKSRETGLKDWTAHVNEVRAAVDAISTNHAAWITIAENCPRADVIEQLRAVILAM